MVLFGLFGKKPRTNVKTGLEEVNIVVREVTALLEPQLALLGKELEDLLSTKHLQGYLMGTLDAVAQRMMIPDNESILVIAAAVAALFPARPGAFGRMLLLSHDADFVRGQAVGRSAAMALLGSRPSLPVAEVEV